MKKLKEHHTMMTSQNGGSMTPPPQNELMRHTVSARSKLYDLIVQFRQDAAKIKDPKAKMLFEFSAEMLAGMARSFRNLEEEPNDPS